MRNCPELQEAGRNAGSATSSDPEANVCVPNRFVMEMFISEDVVDLISKFFCLFVFWIFISDDRSVSLCHQLRF